MSLRFRWRALVVALGLVAGACGNDYVAKPDDLADPALSTDCDAGRAANAVQPEGVTYDYEPSTSLGDLGARLSDAVVKGRVVWRTPREIEGNSFIVMSLRVDEVLDDQTGSVLVGDDLDVAMNFTPSSLDYSDVHDSVSPGIGMVAFLRFNATFRIWQPTLEGLWFACGDEGAVRSGLVPSWSFRGSLDQLAAAIPPAIAEARAGS